MEQTNKYPGFSFLRMIELGDDNIRKIFIGIG